MNMSHGPFKTHSLKYIYHGSKWNGGSYEPRTSVVSRF